MSAFTPGPWQYAFEGGTVAFIVEADGTTVAKLSTLENSTAHSALPANARLIAAAPSMADALEIVLFGLTTDADNNGGEIDRHALIGVVREALKAAGVAS